LAGTAINTGLRNVTIGNLSGTSIADGDDNVTIGTSSGASNYRRTSVGT